MLVGEHATVGTLRPVDDTNEYTRKAVWPRPFMREETMLDRGIMKDLVGPMTTTPPVYWDSPQPPPIPSSHGEAGLIKARQNTVLFPWWEPYNLNEPWPYESLKHPPSMDGLGQQAGAFPTIELLFTAGGVVFAVSGVNNNHPPLIVLGVITTLVAGTHLINKLKS